MANRSTDFDSIMWSNKLQTFVKKESTLGTLGMLTDGAAAMADKPDGDVQAWIQNFTLFKVNGDEFDSYVRANAVAEALVAFDESVNFQGWDNRQKKWLCFLYQTGRRSDTIKITARPNVPKI